MRSAILPALALAATIEGANARHGPLLVETLSMLPTAAPMADSYVEGATDLNTVYKTVEVEPLVHCHPAPGSNAIVDVNGHCADDVLKVKPPHPTLTAPPTHIRHPHHNHLGIPVSSDAPLRLVSSASDEGTVRPLPTLSASEIHSNSIVPSSDEPLGFGPDGFAADLLEAFRKSHGSHQHSGDHKPTEPSDHDSSSIGEAISTRPAAFRGPAFPPHHHYWSHVKALDSEHRTANVVPHHLNVDEHQQAEPSSIDSEHGPQAPAIERRILPQNSEVWGLPPNIAVDILRTIVSDAHHDDGAVSSIAASATTKETATKTTKRSQSSTSNIQMHQLAEIETGEFPPEASQTTHRLWEHGEHMHSHIPRQQYTYWDGKSYVSSDFEQECHSNGILPTDCAFSVPSPWLSKLDEVKFKHAGFDQFDRFGQELDGIRNLKSGRPLGESAQVLDSAKQKLHKLPLNAAGAQSPPTRLLCAAALAVTIGFGVGVGLLY